MGKKAKLRAGITAITVIACCILTEGELHPTDAYESTGADISSANVSLFPQLSYIETAEGCTLQVFVDTTDSISCMECVISYDTSLVRLTSVEEGRLFVEAPFLTFFSWEYVAPGTISVVDCVMGYRSCILPPGEMVKFIFEARQAGVCPIRINEMKLWDIDRIAVNTVVDPSAWITIGAPTGVTGIRRGEGYVCNYPNPFNSTTTIVFSLPHLSYVNLSVFTPEGKLVATLVNGVLAEGRTHFVWDGMASGDTPVSSGMYFYRLQVGDETYTEKMVLLK